MPDTWVQRTADDFARAIENELPQGEAWPRDAGGDLMAWVAGCAQIWGDVEQRSADLLIVESDPRYTVELLPDWERAFGLPDPCVKRVLTLPERQAALVNKLTTQGGQSRAFFIGVAAQLGYTISIQEYRPFQFGLSSFGGSRGALNGPAFQFLWTVTVHAGRLTRFCFGLSSFGRDSFLEIMRAEDLECIFNRWKPAHTIVFFNYVTGYAVGGIETDDGLVITDDNGTPFVAEAPILSDNLGETVVADDGSSLGLN